MKRLLPSSLLGQVLLAIAAALFVAQAVNAMLLYRAQIERQETGLANALAFRLLGPEGRGARLAPPPETRVGLGPRGLGRQIVDRNPIGADERRLPGLERRLRGVLRLQGIAADEVQIVRRSVDDDPAALRALAARARRKGDGAGIPRALVLAAVRPVDSNNWYVARIPDAAQTARRAVGALVLQTLLLTLILFGVLWLVLRRITRPLAMLTHRTRDFTARPGLAERVEMSGPSDIRELIEAHNALESRISGLLDEKDVMLGAIGHDLKTPLAALRVRIENVADAGQRDKMAASVADLDRMLDDILSLARIGRPSDPAERHDLAALVAGLAEEYEDRRKPVTIARLDPVVATVRATWIGRAVRNLVDNALRYGNAASLSLTSDGRDAVLEIQDSGPGIPDELLTSMLEPFRRGENSRNRATGGSGLGLTLARAIAEQHGGTLQLSNRTEGGLSATLRLPLSTR